MLGLSKIAVVVPAHNEARHLARTLSSVPSWVDAIYVVDDASDDETSAIAARWPESRVQLLVHEKNRGVGAAIVTGYQRAFADGADLAAVMAGDAQMDPRDLPALVAPVLAGAADYVKGNRLAHEAVRKRMPRVRYAGNRVLSFLTRIATGLDVHDSQCGYTVLSRRAAREIELDKVWTGYGYPNDVLARASTARLRVCDVIVAPIYADEKSGIGWRHALVVVPFVIARAWLRHVTVCVMQRLVATDTAVVSASDASAFGSDKTGFASLSRRE